MEDHVLLAEPRVRKQLDSLVDSFKLLCASKLNRLIESTKGAASPPELVTALVDATTEKSSKSSMKPKNSLTKMRKRTKNIKT